MKKSGLQENDFTAHMARIGGAANATEPLDPAWLDRLAQFVGDAEARGLFTLVTMVYAPSNAFFAALAEKIPQDAAWRG
jgi:hypothetical protein